MAESPCLEHREPDPYMVDKEQNDTTVKQATIVDKIEKIAIEEETMEMETSHTSFEDSCGSSKVLGLLRKFLEVQQRRAEAYAKLRRYRCVWVSNLSLSSSWNCSLIWINHSKYIMN